MVAALLTSLSYLYTLLLAPGALKSTTDALANGTYGNITNPTNTTRPTIPLVIPCPTLTPRQPPRTILDLRADDIKVVIGVGDSVMAGFGAKGVQNDRFVSVNTLKEARGVSFALGGDQDRVTVPNLIHYYSRNLYGSSVGDQVFTICFGDQFCPSGQYKPQIDGLNGAQSGARSVNLNHELDYLLKELNDAYNNNKIKRTDWKLLTFFIGSNDICHACVVNSSLPAPYAINVQSALERIRLNIPKVLIQIIGMIRVDEIFTATQAYPEYCRPFARSDFVLNDHECMCAHSAFNRTIMAQLMPQYNLELSKIASIYQGPMYANDTFGVVYRPLPVNINTFPIYAISDVDCFHPSALAHEWFAKELW
ncbi:hypothetical protein BC941DRAFT_358009 [Chlamydoabsidia padenii]|nr:hypothetical protein BC941DRAFT_358009 [Chlamydoabsidia padenii]